MNQNENGYVFVKKGGLVYSGGFQVDSDMMSGGAPVAQSISKNFAIPASLSIAKREKRAKSDVTVSNTDEVIGDAIYEKLLGLVDMSSLRKRGTRREKKVFNKTRKHLSKFN
jgi:hypothetical protein